MSQLGSPDWILGDPNPALSIPQDHPEQGERLTALQFEVLARNQLFSGFPGHSWSHAWIDYAERVQELCEGLGSRIGAPGVPPKDLLQLAVLRPPRDLRSVLSTGHE